MSSIMLILSFTRPRLLDDCFQIGLIHASFKLVPPHGFLPAASLDLAFQIVTTGHD